MTVFENVAFGLRVKPRAQRPSEAQIRAKVKDLLELVQLDWLADRYPPQLSGGQRQRVALGRAIVRDPQVFLLDEPLSNLDAKLRLDMRTELKRIHGELGSTFVFVTHDQWEAMTLATKIAVMNDGRLQQVGTPEDIYDRPANRFVAEFVGTLPINILEMNELKHGTLCDWITANLNRLPVDQNEVVSIGVRPETISITPFCATKTETDPLCVAEIKDLVPTGGNWIIELDIAGSRLFALKAQKEGLTSGERVELTIRQSDLHVFDATGDRIHTHSTN